MLNNNFKVSLDNVLNKLIFYSKLKIQTRQTAFESAENSVGQLGRLHQHNSALTAQPDN